MSQKAKQIFQAIRQRCEATGYAYISGRALDIEDATPAISVFYDPSESGGVQSDEGDVNTSRKRTKSRESLHLIVEAHNVLDDVATALEELEDLHTTVAASLIDPDDAQLGGLARSDVAVTRRHNFVPDPGIKLGKIRIYLTIPFVEEL